MLKIVDYYPNTNKPFPLKELEKFGFKFLEYSNRYETNYFKGVDVVCSFMVNVISRELKLIVDDYYDGYCNEVEYANELLFDLIKADLVEKVEEIEKC